MKENNKEEIKKVASEARLKWLEKAEIAIVNGSEINVLPYGYLSQAIIEVLKEEKKKWEINREVGVSEVLAFEAGQKDARAGLLEKIEEIDGIELIKDNDCMKVQIRSNGRYILREDIKNLFKLTP